MGSNSIIAAKWKKLSGENHWEGLLDHHWTPTSAATSSTTGSGSRPCTTPSTTTRSPTRTASAATLPRISSPTSPSRTGSRSSTRSPSSSTPPRWATGSSPEKSGLGRRDILVCWRGTLTSTEWFQGVTFPLVPISDVYGTSAHNPKVHQGFFSVYAHKNPRSTYNKTSAREQVLAEVRRLVEKYRNEETSITVVGHSLGAALATLNATDIVANNYHRPTGGSTTTSCMVTAFAYASPLIGDRGFLNMFNDLPDLRLLRIRNFPDPVTSFPPYFMGFFEVGEELVIYILSPYLKPMLNQHSLELYMHGVAGYNGPHRSFELVVGRDVALVNKREDHLKDEYKVPPNWWNVKYKGMKQLDDGSWEMDGYIPPPPDHVPMEFPTVLSSNVIIARIM